MKVSNQLTSARKQSCFALSNCKRRLLVQMLLAIFYMFPVMSLANAQTPQRTTAAYYDWTVSCATTAAGHKSCGLVQTLQSQTSPAGQIGIGRSAGNGAMRLSVEVPANVWLPGGLKLVLSDRKTVVSATFKMCVAGRCIADADLTNEQIDMMRTQANAGSVEYANAAQSNVSLPVSFHGFAEATEALKKEQSSLAPSSGPTQDRLARGDTHRSKFHFGRTDGSIKTLSLAFLAAFPP